ncbi:class I SAM-dependent methyltransferase [Chitinophaga horti]|uniref:Class I SAM-dependent methyltransferase n=1 Tax=Chitinophaga horti TaxID=2920382 RepID=A0ABY6IWT7_9BACT|nr:class I SAM-dependent methyltransferase [Chitinophaga horti]UYQ91765.1 class I SAM-dependent methyltransferase [Chitinophaga horti]
MTDNVIARYPGAYAHIDEATRQSGFNMASDPMTGALLRTLAASKPGGRFLELGTGTGLSTSWILEGMDSSAHLISIDNDANLLNIARTQLADRRLHLELADGGEWLQQHRDQQFDYIFADTWHGKYLLLEEALHMLRPGALYIIDDMLPQPNWPDGHAEKATNLLKTLDEREDLVLTRLCWATGIVIATKKA